MTDTRDKTYLKLLKSSAFFQFFPYYQYHSEFVYIISLRLMRSESGNDRTDLPNANIWSLKKDLTHSHMNINLGVWAYRVTWWRATMVTTNNSS